MDHHDRRSATMRRLLTSPTSPTPSASTSATSAASSTRRASPTSSGATSSASTPPTSPPGSTAYRNHHQRGDPAARQRQRAERQLGRALGGVRRRAAARVYDGREVFVCDGVRDRGDPVVAELGPNLRGRWRETGIDEAPTEMPRKPGIRSVVQ